MGERGIMVGEPLEGFHGILTGTPTILKLGGHAPQEGP
jgi:hypothetical protein